MRRYALVFLIAAALAVTAGLARAEDYIQATYQGTLDSPTVYIDGSAVPGTSAEHVMASRMQWKRFATPGTNNNYDPSNPALDGFFNTYCVDVVNNVSWNLTRFEVKDLSGANGAFDSATAKLIAQLWNEATALDGAPLSLLGDTAGAFQIALWEILYDGNPGVGLLAAQAAMASDNITFSGENGTVQGKAETYLAGLASYSDSATSLKVMIANDPNQPNQNQVFIVNVPPDVTPTVPVPAAAWLGMMLFGGLGLAKKLRRH